MCSTLIVILDSLLPSEITTLVDGLVESISYFKVISISVEFVVQSFTGILSGFSKIFQSSILIISLFALASKTKLHSSKEISFGISNNKLSLLSKVSLFTFWNLLNFDTARAFAFFSVLLACGSFSGILTVISCSSFVQLTIAITLNFVSTVLVHTGIESVFTCILQSLKIDIRLPLSTLKLNFAVLDQFFMV